MRPVTSVLKYVGSAVQTAVAAHDTTGGMSTKIAEAASIAAMGIDVFIVEVITYLYLFQSF